MTKKKKVVGRSKFEKAVLSELDKKDISYEYEPSDSKLDYVIESTYLPDLRLPNGVLVEIKGYFDQKTRTKMRIIKETYPDLDIRLLFMRDERIFQKNPNSMRYSEWATQHGYVWAIGKDIPEEWLH